ncbi:MAG: WecB/TagA/CpsF family glycosyltransferase [Paraglaciecola sp.]|uniref:WecB/TagA/CpsF family glycosyltransferase n=1 Tax=Paraglaciecola sp. TaxID=1920173 RepID=UPI003299F760
MEDKKRSQREYCRIIDMNVDVTNLNSALLKVNELANQKSGSYVCVSNVHMCIETTDNQQFEKVVNSADLVIPDGKPLSWGQKLLGYTEARQVRGQDIMNALCNDSGKNSLNIGFYGGSSEELLQVVADNMLANYPDINITYMFSPPFRPLTEVENSTVINDINNANVNVLFVGIGCPKQELWMADHKESLNCVMLGVGAAFDFIAGSKKHAPRWVQNIGMEWFFRLCTEPKRLWKRYLYTNPRFIWGFGKQLVKHRLG